MIKFYRAFVFLSLFAAMNLTAMDLKPGIKINEFESEMKKHGYKAGSCGQKRAMLEGSEIKCFKLNHGLLIVTYLNANKAVVKLSYYLSDGRAKSERTSFYLKVIGFDPANGEMRIAPVNPESIKVGPD